MTQQDFNDHIELWNRTAALSRLAGNENLLDRIVQMYLDQVEQKQMDLRSAIEAKNVEAIRFHSHSMKGVSGDVGADAVKQKSADIENLAKQNQLDTISHQMTQLDDLIAATTQVMQGER
ncbi:hypothetical protein D210916BOD24_18430 [Alteromonas sp. D210916BOD_24]|uniref:Hpt domain-containing protein n=1 Tax=Alteromonas sp. D210916BOD_24 TaxID=3157618 RepID=UPI00399CFE6B